MKVARAIFLLAAIPLFFPDVLPVLPAPAIQVLAGALLLVPLGAVIEAAMEYVIHHVYLIQRRRGVRKFVAGEEELLEKHATARAQFIGSFIHSFVSNLAFLVITGTVLVSAASAGAQTREELVGVVLSSIAGNLVINILFVLGIATIIGGWLHKGVAYDIDNANAYAEMLTLAVIALGLPTLAYRLNLSVGFGGQVFRIGTNEAAQLSDITAIVLLVAFVGYFLYLVVGLRTSEISEGAKRRTEKARERRRRRGRRARRGADADNSPPAATLGAITASTTSAEATEPRVAEADAVVTTSSQEGRSLFVWLGLPGAIAAVVIAGGGIAWISERMAGALETGLKEGFLPGITLNAFFVGFILLPLASHVAEVLAAISMSTHVEPAVEHGGASGGGPKTGEPHLESCQGITIGSSIQIALLVAPLLLLWGHFLGVTEMNLIFSPFLLAIFGLMVFLLQVNVFDGKTDWLEGMELVLFFVLLASVAFLAGPVAS
jgi:Ca2+:H+ antiporter